VRRIAAAATLLKTFEDSAMKHILALCAAAFRGTQRARCNDGHVDLLRRLREAGL
jgi:hypothetical protein